MTRKPVGWSSREKQLSAFVAWLLGGTERKSVGPIALAQGVDRRQCPVSRTTAGRPPPTQCPSSASRIRPPPARPPDPPDPRQPLPAVARGAAGGPRGSRLRSAAVRAASRRHLIEEAFENAKGEVGLDHEVRAWREWHHHMTASLNGPVVPGAGAPDAGEKELHSPWRWCASWYPSCYAGRSRLARSLPSASTSSRATRRHASLGRPRARSATMEIRFPWKC